MPKGAVLHLRLFAVFGFVVVLLSCATPLVGSKSQRTPSAETLPFSIAVNVLPQAKSSSSQTPHSFQIQMQITGVEQYTDFLQIQLPIPAGWKIESQDSAGGTFKIRQLATPINEGEARYTWWSSDYRNADQGGKPDLLVKFVLIPPTGSLEEATLFGTLIFLAGSSANSVADKKVQSPIRIDLPTLNGESY